MQLKNSINNYGTLTKIFHWVIAILVFMLFALGISFLYMPDGPLKIDIIKLHKSIGLTILFLIVLRFVWRMFNERPTLPTVIPKWQRQCADLSHVTFYVILFLMPLSGWILSVAAGHPPSYFGLFTLNLPIHPNKEVANFFADIHEIFAWILGILITIHIIAVLKHHFYDKTIVLKRMM